jgi:hypothetical protein
MKIFFLASSSLKLKATSSSETSVYFHLTTRSYIVEDKTYNIIRQMIYYLAEWMQYNYANSNNISDKPAVTNLRTEVQN